LVVIPIAFTVWHTLTAFDIKYAIR
jgi:hypothetical protein